MVKNSSVLWHLMEETHLARGYQSALVGPIVNALEGGQSKKYIGNLEDSAEEIAVADKMHRMETDLQVQLSLFTKRCFLSITGQHKDVLSPLHKNREQPAPRITLQGGKREALAPEE